MYTLSQNTLTAGIRLRKLALTFAVILGALGLFVPKSAEAQCISGAGKLWLLQCPLDTTVTVGDYHYVQLDVLYNDVGTATYDITCEVDGVASACSLWPYTSLSFYGFGYGNTLVEYYTASAGVGHIIVRFAGPDTLVDTITVHAENDFFFDPEWTNSTDQMLSLCAVSCFAGSTSYSTVPFYTLNTPRNVSLVYHEDRANPRPVVFALVDPVWAATPEYWVLSATLDGARVTFVNGDTLLYFDPMGGEYLRLAGQFDARSYNTGVYTLTVTVTARYAGGATAQHSYTKPLVIVNERSSPFGRGWSMAGFQRLYFPSGGQYLVTDGTGDAILYSALNTKAKDFTWLTYDAVTQRYTKWSVDSSRVVFNNVGLMLGVWDYTGRQQVAIEYDVSNRPISVKEPLRISGATTVPYITFTYGTNGRLSSISESGGSGASRISMITMNSDSSIITIADPDGVTIGYTYDSNKRLKTLTDRRGGVTQYIYDSVTWKLVRTELPSVPINNGSGTPLTTPKINYTPWLTAGVPKVPTNTNALATPARIYGNDVLAVVTDAIGRQTKFSVLKYGKPVNITDPAGRTTTVIHDFSLGGNDILPVRIQYPSGGVDSLWYASGTPLVTRMRKAGDSVINFRYGAKAQIDSVWGPGRDSERRFLDASGRVYSIRYVGSDLIRSYTIYDSLNRVTSYTDPGTHVYRYNYDSKTGNTDSISGPGGRYAVTRFDAYGRDSASRGSGVIGWQYATYDLLNRMTKLWRTNPAADTTLITYDSLFPKRIRGFGGQIYKFETNDLGWITKQYDTKDTTLFTSYLYDTAGRVTRMINRRNQQSDMTYDILDRLLTRTAGIGIPADTFGYSLDGRRQWSIRKNVSRDTIFLNLRGQTDSIIRKIAGHRYAITYSYSDFQNGTKRIVTIKNDAAINFSQETDIVRSTVPSLDSVIITGGRGAGTSTLFRNRDGLINNTRWPSSAYFYHEWWYTAQHQPYHMIFNPLSTNHTINDSLSRIYTYDSLGQVVDDHLWINTTTNRITHRNFSYDAIGQLLKVVLSRDSACTIVEDSLALGINYTCASVNRIAVQDSATYDRSGNRLFSGATYTALGNRITSGPTGVSYAYDQDGNLVKRTRNGVADSLFWSVAGMLDSVASPGLRRRYEYNAYGQLVRRQTKVGAGAYVTDRHFVWDGTHLIAELDDPGTKRRAQYIYYKGVDQPFAIITDSANSSLVRYFFQDPVEGNLTAVMRDSIRMHQMTSYTAWGTIYQRPINILGDTNRLGWKGLFYEGDSTRLYYMRSRWYDPVAGRFISEDPLGLEAGMNFYMFSGNNPISGNDPTGQCAFGQLSDPDDFSAGAHNARKGFVLAYRGSAIKCKGNGWDDPWVWSTTTLAAVEVGAGPSGSSSGGSGFGGFGGAGGFDGGGGGSSWGEETRTVPSGYSLPGSFHLLNTALIIPPQHPGNPVPQYALDVLKRIRKTGWVIPGYKGGKKYENDGRSGSQILPKFDKDGNPILYQEWDVVPLSVGKRGMERLVTGSDGSAYYTRNHYKFFFKIP